MYIYIYIYTYTFEDPKFFAVTCHDALQGVVLHVCQLETRAWEPQEVTIVFQVLRQLLKSNRDELIPVRLRLERPLK